MAQIYWLLLFERSWSLAFSYHQEIAKRNIRKKERGVNPYGRFVFLVSNEEEVAGWIVGKNRPWPSGKDFEKRRETKHIRFGLTPRSLVFFFRIKFIFRSASWNEGSWKCGDDVIGEGLRLSRHYQVVWAIVVRKQTEIYFTCPVTLAKSDDRF